MKQWNERTEEERQKILAKEDAWILRNLFKCRTSVIPNETIDEIGIELVEHVLTQLLGKKVIVDTREHKGEKTLYLAEVVGW